MSRIIASAQDLTDYLTSYPHEITFGDEPPDVVLDRYHTPECIIANNGIELDRQRLLDHVRPARKRTAAVRVEVIDALLSGSRVAARYVLTATMRDGAEIANEIHMFGRLAGDGRLQRVDQLTRMPD